MLAVAVQESTEERVAPRPGKHTDLIGQRRDSFSLLRDTLRWRVAVVMAVLVIVLMVALASLNTSLGMHDTARLAWAVLGVALVSLVGLMLLPRRTGGTIYFASIAVLLAVTMGFGLAVGRPMQHWAYIMPPVLVFLMRPKPALAWMIVFGAWTVLVTAPMVEVLDLVRFASGYGLLVCFMFTYALLQHRAANMLRFHSGHDALTNCLNRRTFNELLGQLAMQPPDGRLSFLLIDLDHFKAVNDNHGHLVGDRVITEAAAALGRELSPGTPLFRYGGEEFAVVLAEGEAGAVALAERLRRAIAGAVLQGLELTVSIGVAEWRHGSEPIDAALGRADDALYEAKRRGRNRVVSAGMRAAPALFEDCTAQA